MNQAILTAARGSAALGALLGTDPRNNLPAISYGHKSQMPPVYDCVTFRENTLDNDARFYDWSFDRQFYDFEIWTRKRTSDAVDNILKQLDALFHRKRLDLPDPTNNYMFWMRRVPGANLSGWSDKEEAFLGLVRYVAWTVSP